MRIYALRVLAISLLCVVWVPRSAAPAVHHGLDRYALFASEVLRLRGLRALGGDLGVNAGTLAASRGLDAASSQVVAATVRTHDDVRCLALRTNAAVSTGPACPLAGSVGGAIISDLPAACGYPTSFPACDPAGRVVVAPGTTRVLAPGVYGEVVVAGAETDAGTLTLAGGTYVFCGLRVGRNGRITADAP